jgi:hypothetical protein
VIAAEGLEYFNWYDERPPQPHEVGIVPEGIGWRVYNTDERANWRRFDPRLHEDEDVALDDFLDRLRRLNRMVARWALDPSTRPY